RLDVARSSRRRVGASRHLRRGGRHDGKPVSRQPRDPVLSRLLRPGRGSPLVGPERATYWPENPFHRLLSFSLKSGHSPIQATKISAWGDFSRSIPESVTEPIPGNAA